MIFQLTLVINSQCAYPLYNPPIQGQDLARIGHVASRDQFATQHPWLTALVALAAVQIASSGTLKGHTLASFADILQFTIMIAMVVGTALNIRPSRGSARGFWVLMTLSASMWAGDYGTWVYYEVIRGVHMPVPQPGDTLLILHVVPIMMALAMMPHRVLKSG